MSICYIELDGEMVSRAEYCRRLGYNYDYIYTIKNYYKIPWEDALQKYLSTKDRRISKDKLLRAKWHNMMDRCYNPKCKEYKWYGERGIKVCERWHDYFNFEDDLYDSYIKHVEEFGQLDTTLERNDYNKDYELVNVTWKTRKEQQNNKSSNVWVTDNTTMAEECERLNLPYNTIRARVQIYGWSWEKAINTPVKKRPPITILSTGETIPQFCKRTGMAETTVRRNLAKGKSIEEIESMVIVHHYLPCKNNKMPLKQHCKQNDYNYEQVVYFINKYNLKPHKALARYLARKEK